MKDIANILLLLLNFNRIYGQFSLGCPIGWEVHGSNCYLFEKDDIRIFQEVDAACRVNGAILLSVNDINEHKFVSDWLVKHDSLDGSVWFTSGVYEGGSVVWNGDSTVTGQGVDFWSTGFPPGNDTIYTRIAYTREGQEYGWRVVSESVASAYICEMSKVDAQELRIVDRDYKYGWITDNIRDIERGPVILEQPRSLAVFNDPPNVFIECKAIANPAPTFGWTRDNNGGQTVTPVLDNRYTLTAGRFSIQDPADQKDAGEYTCIVENKFGKILSNPAKIIFGSGDLQSFPLEKPKDVTANTDEGSRISCQAPAAFPGISYHWFVNSIAEPILEGHQNMFVSSTGDLYFSSVQLSDGREYFCSVTLMTSSEYDTALVPPPSKISLGVNLIVTQAELQYFKPVLYTHIFPSPALRGAQLRLECVAYGSLPLEYSWRRVDGRNFEPGTRFTDHNRVLIIEDATIQAEGVYTCTVNGHAGVTSADIALKVEAKPYFPFGIGDRFVDRGQTVTWRCQAVAKPQPTYSWYKNGVLISNQPGVIEIHKYSLKILNVDAARDEGMYQCGATNVHGTTFSYGQLKVLSFRPTFDKYPMVPHIQIPLGGKFKLPCRVEAAPLPAIVWLKNGVALPLTPGEVEGHAKMTFENDLVLDIIESSDSGVYTCKASNENGEATISTRAEVIGDITISNPPVDTRVLVNRTAFLSCQASVDSLSNDLTYQWRFNGHLIDTEDDPHFLLSKEKGLDGLYIRNVQFKHTGKYTCDARTRIHVASMSANLVVFGPPGAPAGVYVVSTSVTSYSVRIAWTISSAIIHGSPIHSYDIEAEVGIYPGEWKPIATDVPEVVAMNEAINFGLRQDQRSTVVSGLSANTAYRFRVRAINAYGKGLEASWGSASVQTQASPPLAVPKNIRGLDEGKVGTLNIVWDPLDESEYGGSGVGYNVYLRKSGDQREWFNAKAVGPKNSMYTHLIGVENFYLEYSVKVGAFNNFGSGPNSSVHTIMSAEGMPIAYVLMGDSDNHNESAFSLTWTPVEDTRKVLKGRLKGYRVKVGYWRDHIREQVMWRDLYGQHDSTTIAGLKDNTTYWASVQVMNFAGVGPVGETRYAETSKLAPSDFPRNVTVWPDDRHSVRVTWQAVSTHPNEESLQGYIIRIWKIEEDIRTARDVVVQDAVVRDVVKDKVREAVIEGLETQTVYILRVLGYSTGGDGTLSPHVYFTVEGGSVPFDPTTTRFCVSQKECD